MLKRATKRGERVGPRWLGLLVSDASSFLARVLGVKIGSIGGAGLEAEKEAAYLYVWHPHGFISFTPCTIYASWAVGGEPHGREWFGMCLPLLFSLPLLGEYFTLANARPVDRKSLESLLTSGASVAIQPGGVREQAATRHDQEQAFFSKKLGFVKAAMRHGRPLMPMYFFGENQMYSKLQGFDWFTKGFKRLTGLTVPVCAGKFYLPFALLLPLATTVHIRYGNAVPVGPPNSEPTDEQAQKVFQAYRDELQKLFDEHASTCLPPHVAKRGLKIVMY